MNEIAKMMSGMLYGNTAEDEVETKEDGKVVVTKMCPACKNKFSVELWEGDYINVQTLSASKALSKYDKFLRESFISGLCYDCQSKTFNQPKPGEDWGEQLECPNCCSSVYQKNFKEDRQKYVCPSCGFPFTKEMAENPDAINWDDYASDEDGYPT